MNKRFLDKLEDNKDAIIKLVNIDNRVMGSSYNAQDILDMINYIRNSHYKNINITSNSLILADCELVEIIKLFAYIDTDKDFIFFPNYSYLGLTSLFSTVFNLAYGEHSYLAKEKNYDKYLQMQNDFDAIYVYGEEIVYEAMKYDFSSAMWIDSQD